MYSIRGKKDCTDRVLSVAIGSIIILAVSGYVQESFAGNGLKVIVHVYGQGGEVCVSSTSENLGCRFVSSQRTFEFDNSPDTFSVCFNGDCQSGTNSPAKRPEHVYLSGGDASSSGLSGGDASSSGLSGGDASNTGMIRDDLITKLCNLAETNRILADGIASMLDYQELDEAVRELCPPM